MALIRKPIYARYSPVSGNDQAADQRCHTSSLAKEQEPAALNGGRRSEPKFKRDLKSKVPGMTLACYLLIVLETGGIILREFVLISNFI